MDTIQVLKLTEEGAAKIIKAAAAKTKEVGVPMSIAVVDEGANLLAFVRTQGGKPHNVRIALAKARAAASNRMPTGKTGSVGQPLDDAGASAIVFAAGPEFYTTLAGGLPIEVQGQCVGGIGVSGGTGQQDLEIAQAGLDALK